MSTTAKADGHPYLAISIAFVAWKAGLVAIAVGSQVGPTYDTSSGLLIDPDQNTGRLLTRLTSWDAIYFVKAAQRGYLFEQEWAFGSALPWCISVLIQVLTTLGLVNPSALGDGTAYLESLVGVLFTNTCHYLSTLVLYQLGRQVWADARWALCAALLHILSPGGLFLSAPYAESPFSLLSFVGWLLLVTSCRCGTTRIIASGLSRDILTLLAGAVFGLATVFRTNGLLNGTPFAFEFLSTLYHLVEDLDYAKTPSYLRKLVVLGLSGLLVAAGSAVPQFIAYRMYCSSPAAASDARPSWCLNIVPSIFNHVQQQYWNTGFLRYWTFSNAPLFLLAGPMLLIMGKSGKDLFFQASQLSRYPAASPSPTDEAAATAIASTGQRSSATATSKQQTAVVDTSRLTLIVQSMVASQVILVGLTFTSYHVQIISRLCSGYPAWYWWVAACFRSRKTRKVGGGVVVFMVMYACIQAVLFASFLPPA